MKVFTTTQIGINIAIQYFRNIYNPMNPLLYNTRTARYRIAILERIEIFPFTRIIVPAVIPGTRAVLLEIYNIG
jgi:hypothetical protein